MRLLAIDIGTGTQDILLFDSTQTIENCVKMVMPSATAIIARRIEQATRENKAILLTGVTMGGGPSAWAVDAHLKTGGKAYATADAARSFNDDLAWVEQWGVKVVGEDEAVWLTDAENIPLKDLDLDTIGQALATFGLEPRYDGLAVAVLDHGAAPPGVSDRTFRFDHLRRTVERHNQLDAFIYLAPEVPSYLTRMQAVMATIDLDLPVLMMDTGPAAALGALEDPQVAENHRRIIANLGNMHTLAFHMEGNTILGLFEHHTGMLTTEKMDALVDKLRSGVLTNQEVYDDGGHGAFMVRQVSTQAWVAVTGPRRRMMAGSTLRPYFPAPHGDMMLTGCFGLVRAFSLRQPSWRDEIEAALSGDN